ncbi:MAG: cation-translocating P-type ATPase [Deltaproteobacteria bacterium]|nr:cation-translocating P-type ATPase [Deltaproteobacteria bacterium]
MTIPSAPPPTRPNADAIGLTALAAAQRLTADGPNELQRQQARPAWRLLLSQFASPLIGMLIAAAIVAGALGDVAEAVAIVAIVLLNAIVGFLQEHRAERAVLALRSMTAPRARVLRDGLAKVVPAAEVVVGDVLLLEGGDVVAADARLVSADALRVVEATLTGESEPVQKTTAPTPAETPLAERRDHVFMGTAIAAGSGRAVVVATGPRTELGHIAHLLATVEQSETPLQRQLAKVGKSLGWLCLGVVGVVVALGLFRGEPWLLLLETAISLAVAAVPEGLPAIVTIALAIGVERMAARQVLVRRLPAVEALGSATVICTDKTGTLTRGVMQVRERWTADGVRDEQLIYAAAACCDAELAALRDSDAFDPDLPVRGVGDPTEIALLDAARRGKIERVTIERDNPRVRTWPFDAEQMQMAVLRADGKRYVKGALDRLLPSLGGGAAAQGTSTQGASAQGASAQGVAESARAANAALAGRGLRVLAVAEGHGDDAAGELRLLGLFGIADPPRPAAIEAVRVARAAGVRTVMLTGDHPTTADAIAREMGIVVEGEPPPAGLDRAVFARVTPAEKLALVRRLKSAGEIVAMTGDGTNDAPALKEAHVGVAMGRTGVEVTREAADLVLGDDDFASVVAAIREGRGIYDNIKKALCFLLAGNTAELLVVLGASVLALPLPLLPLHLLWVNLVTDGLPGLALVMDPASDDALDRPPRAPDAPMLDADAWRHIGAVGVLTGAVTLGVYLGALRAGWDLVAARTVALHTLVVAQMGLSLTFRSFRRIYPQTVPSSNPRLIGVVVLTCALQVGLAAWEPSRSLFALAAPEPLQLGIAAVAGLLPPTLFEFWKLLRPRSGAR